MYNKIKLILQAPLSREKAMIAGALALCIALSLWISASPQEKPSEMISGELVVPAGYLIVPLELANANALASLISREAVINLFQDKKMSPLAENLKVIKLSAGEGPLFGALVPQKIAGALQEIFSGPKLRGAIRTKGPGPATFHLAAPPKRTLLEEVSTTDSISGESI